jgi:hypothetical protein
MFRLYLFLIGMRRRHPWLHRATTTAVRLDNRHYVYVSRHHDDALLVALNIDDAPLPVSLRDFGFQRAEVLGCDDFPAQTAVAEAVVVPHGWLVLRPT